MEQPNRVLAYQLATTIDQSSLKEISGGQLSWHWTTFMTGGLDNSTTGCALHIDQKFDS